MSGVGAGDPIAEDNPNKRQKKNERSPVWKFFTKIYMPGSQTVYNQVKCNYCKDVLKCTSSNGTSTCHNHAKRCKPNPFYSAANQSQSLISYDKETNKAENWKFEQDVSRVALAKMIIIDEMPFVTVERLGFRGFVGTIQPRFKHVSRVTIARDCLNLYVAERSKLKEFVKKNVQRVALTTDIWTSLQTQSYLCLTAHFIDKQWNLHKRILNFCVINDHKGDSIGKLIESCLKDWSIEGVSTITVDNASANDVGISYLKRKLVARNNCLLQGEYIHVRCCAHILNLIVRDGLLECDDSMKRIRASVKYIRGSPKRLKLFNVCVRQEYGCEQNKLRSLALDVPTRWNSTYTMLTGALKFEKAIDRMAIEDMFENLDEGPPTVADWEQAKLLVKFLVIFYDCTKRLSGTLYVTSSQYFQEVGTIKYALMEYGNSSSPGLRLMASRMMDKFEKYWESLDKVNLMLMVASVLDPRVKMNKLEFLIDKLKLKRPGENLDMAQATRNTLESLFTCYSGTEASSTVGNESDINMPDCSAHVDVNVAKNWDIEFEESLESKQNEDGRTELDRYLAVKNVKNDANFDVLGWWKNNAAEYPVLSTMAKDILAIPVSTVASESAFSTGSRVLDRFRSSLTPKTVQSLICAQDWLCGSSLLDVEETLENMDEIEQSVDAPDIHEDWD